jgi:hypothetical protein
MTRINDEDRFDYDIKRAMDDPMYRIEISLNDIQDAVLRLKAEYEALLGRLNNSATRPRSSGNAEHCPF